MDSEPGSKSDYSDWQPINNQNCGQNYLMSSLMT